ncbi:TPA: hypothetical protein JAN90_08785 [Legionella pneumophila]|nr:hypothetical protein [Legionella pneumophila]HAT8867323.1 hypothetical protein [Legionella pneumophila subsp. pneumophila]HAT7072845.1 hypothetical protein [Legionella pneumophila]HAT8642613.1 hypothetical protein [Legionella pneumophila]HAT8932575.1 hypothetical protein [Legionella pneumophila subsp. pneumophila]HAU0163839.1 hypothetical protein [Legionella pneumophila]
MNKRNWTAYYNSTKQNTLPRKSLLNDFWNTRTDMTFLNREMICHLFLQFKIEYFQEEEKDEMDALGYYKHWHKFFIVAKKIA